MRTCTQILILLLLVPAAAFGQIGGMKDHWTTVQGNPTKEDLRKVIDQVEMVAKSDTKDEREVENLLTYTANIAAYKLKEFHLASRCYEILWENKLSSNANLGFLIGVNIVYELERDHTMDIKVYEAKLKKAAGHLETWTEAHPNEVKGHYNLGALYYNYISHIQEHKIYDYDRNINAAGLSKTHLEKAKELDPDDEHITELIEAVDLILGQGNYESSFNRGK